MHLAIDCEFLVSVWIELRNDIEGRKGGAGLEALERAGVFTSSLPQEVNVGVCQRCHGLELKFPVGGEGILVDGHHTVGVDSEFAEHSLYKKVID